MELKFIGGSNTLKLSARARTFITFAAKDAATLINSFKGELFEDYPDNDDFDTRLHIAFPFDRYANVGLHIELIAEFKPVDASREFDKSVRFFRLNKRNSHAFEKPFTVFFDTYGRAYALDRCLSIREHDDLYCRCSESQCVRTDAYTLVLYLIEDQDGVVIV